VEGEGSLSFCYSASGNKQYTKQMGATGDFLTAPPFGRGYEFDRVFASAGTVQWQGN